MVEFLLSVISASVCLFLPGQNRQSHPFSSILLVSSLDLIQAHSFIDKSEDSQRIQGDVFQSNLIFIEEVENVHDLASTHPTQIQARSGNENTSNFQPGVVDKGGWNPIIRTYDKLQRQPKKNSLKQSENDSVILFHEWDNPNLKARTFEKALRDLNGRTSSREKLPYGKNRPQIQVQTTKRPRLNLVFAKKKPKRPGSGPSKTRFNSSGTSSSSANGIYHRPQNQRPGLKGARNPAVRGLHRMARRIRLMVDGMMKSLFGLFRKPKRNPGISQSNKRPRKNRRPSPGTGYNSPNTNNVGNNDRPSHHQNSQVGVSSGTYNTLSSSSPSHTSASNSLPLNGYGTPLNSGNQLKFQSSNSGTVLISSPTITYGAFKNNGAASASSSSSSTASTSFIPSSSNANRVPTFNTVNSHDVSNGVSTSNVYSNSNSGNSGSTYPVISSSPLGSRATYNNYNTPQGTSSPSTTGASNSQIFSSYTNTLSNSIRTVRDPSNTPGKTRHEPCFNCNKNSESGTGTTPPSTKYVSPGTIFGLGSDRTTREISEKKKDMFELRMAWYHYHQKLKDFEAKYNKEDKDLARFRKEIAEGTASNFPYLIGLKSPQLVEDVDFSESISTPLSTNLFSTGSQNHVDASEQPTTLHSSYVGSLLQTVIDPYKGTIGPGYSYSSTPIYPKEIQDTIPEVNVKATTNPFTRKPRSFPQTRPNVGLPSQQHENKPDKDVSTNRKYEVFDLKTSLANKYPELLTPQTSFNMVQYLGQLMEMKLSNNRLSVSKENAYCVDLARRTNI